MASLGAGGWLCMVPQALTSAKPHGGLGVQADAVIVVSSLLVSTLA